MATYSFCLTITIAEWIYLSTFVLFHAYLVKQLLIVLSRSSKKRYACYAATRPECLQANET